MISLSRLTPQMEDAHDEVLHTGATAESPACYAVTVFTQRYNDVRDFYVDLLNAQVLYERQEHVCVLEVGGLPICLRQADHGELVSYLHLHLELKNQEAVLGELRQRGIIVTSVGPYTNFRDPEGRVIKLSEEKTVVC